MTDKVAVLIVSGTVDKMMAGAIITSGVVANDMEADVFFSFWGLINLQKKGALPPTLSYEAGPMGEAMMKIMQEKNVPSWIDTLRTAKELGKVRVYACSMTMDLLGVTKEDLDPIVDEVVGVGEFVAMSKNSQIIFI